MIEGSKTCANANVTPIITTSVLLNVSSGRRVDRELHSLQQGSEEHMTDGDADLTATLLGGSNSSIHFTEAESSLLNAVTPGASPLLLPAPEHAHRVTASSPLNHAISSTAESGGATEQDVAARRLAHLQQLHKLYKV